MYYFSTRNSGAKLSASEAIIKGLSDEGGLFIPSEIPKIDLEKMTNFSYEEIAAEVLELYLTDYSKDFLQAATKKAYSLESFSGKAAKLEKLDKQTFVLELFHGKTLAFKDYALQIMPHLFVEAKRINKATAETLILVATSGDTGKAALEGYKDVAGVSIAVFYPEKGTSLMQRLQMATQSGKNVYVYAIDGNFDDAQTAVKRIFEDKKLQKELLQKNIQLSSANSINWGRLVPQIAYYIKAYVELLDEKTISNGEKINFTVPTGNFGDILAGYFAKKMGVPIGKLICASNENNILTDFFKTGVYDTNRAFVKTSSPSMDILVSSNLERLLYLETSSDEYVKGCMSSLKETGKFGIEKDLLSKINETFFAYCATGEEVQSAINSVQKKYNYLIDPHTAVGFCAYNQHKNLLKDEKMIILSTASPYKFPKEVCAAIGIEGIYNEFAALKLLSSTQKTKAPAEITELQDKPVRFTKTIAPNKIAEAIETICAEHKGTVLLC